jgi:hypothetical protein
VWPFELLRLSRPQETSRTTPRSHVFGHLLCQSADNPNVYDGVAEVTTQVYFRDVLTNHETGEPMLLPQSAIDVTLGQDGVLSFALDAEFVNDITDAIEADERASNNLAVAEEGSSSDSDTADAEADSDALRLHQQQLREQARVNFSAPVLSEGSRRSRQPYINDMDRSQLAFFNKFMKAGHSDTGAKKGKGKKSKQ